VRIGIAHHLGWAVAVTADGADHRVVDRRRLELVEPGVPVAPVEHELAGLSDEDAADLLRTVRASVARATGAALDDLAGSLAGAAAVRSVSLRAWPPDFPTDLGHLRRPPFASRADSVMYLRALADAATARGWAVHLYDAKDVEAQARRLLGHGAPDVLDGPRAALGPPWGKDQRTALAATVLAG
jgi:hypothetical protein